MSGISTGTGLFSGIDFVSLVDSLISVQRRPAARMEAQVGRLQREQTAVSTLEATLLSFSSTLSSLRNETTFDSVSTSNSDKTQLTVSASSDAPVGSYALQSLRLASTQEYLSRGYANSDTQTLAAGTVTLNRSGRVDSDVSLDLLNGGVGVARGEITITDRSGAAATIDLTSAVTLDEVLQAINASDDISVTASVVDRSLVLTDTSGGGGNLTVADVGVGSTATELGIAGSVAADELTGTEIGTLSEDSPLSVLDDGLGLRRFSGAPDLILTLTDDTVLEVNLDDAESIGDVLGAINNHEDNGGRLTASFADGQFTLTDTTGGAGTFTAEDNTGAAVLRTLGLDEVVAGSVLTGRDLRSDLQSVQLRNLNGGVGVTAGTISLTDRAGNTAALDLSGADSLQDVLSAINSATDGGTPLGLEASLDSTGTGIVITDTTGATASNLIISDVSGSLAADLNIAIDAADTEVASGSLGRRAVNEATTLSEYAAFKRGIDPGSISITDSAGNTTTVSLSSAVETIGDVIDRINAASDVSVTASLNESGDGFQIVDTAGGAGTLSIEDIDGTTAADLKIAGDAVGGTITSSQSISITTDGTQTLGDLVTLFGEATDRFDATIFETGAAVNPSRLRLTAADSGSEGAFFIGADTIGLDLAIQSEAEDALLRLGKDAATGFLLTSSDNSFTGVAGGLDVQLQQLGEKAATVSVTENRKPLSNALKGLVSTYNSIVDTADTLTQFNSETNERGVLQGKSITGRLLRRLDNLLTRALPGTGSQDVQSLFDVGITVGEGGKLSFDEDRFTRLLDDDPAAVRTFFLDEETGFGAASQSVIDSLTDDATGMLTLERESIERTSTSLNNRVEELDAILEVRRVRLLEQFVQMEEILASLDVQQTALSSLAGIVPR